MDNTDVTAHALREIRDEVVRTNARLDETNAWLDQTNARLDETNARLDQTNERLDLAKDELSRAIVESEVRTAPAINGLPGVVGDIAHLLASGLDLRDRVECCENAIEGIKRRLGG